MAASALFPNRWTWSTPPKRPHGIARASQGWPRPGQVPSGKHCMFRRPNRPRYRGGAAGSDRRCIRSPVRSRAGGRGDNPARVHRRPHDDAAWPARQTGDQLKEVGGFPVPPACWLLAVEAEFERDVEVAGPGNAGRRSRVGRDKASLPRPRGGSSTRSAGKNTSSSQVISRSRPPDSPPGLLEAPLRARVCHGLADLAPIASASSPRRNNTARPMELIAGQRHPRLSAVPQQSLPVSTAATKRATISASDPVSWAVSWAMMCRLSTTSLMPPREEVVGGDGFEPPTSCV